MRAITRFRAVILSTLCLLAMLANVNCGEYLLLHYLSNPGWTPVDEQSDSIESDASSDETEDSTAGGVSADSVAADMGLDPACKDGDLNKDGAVDGLDIQFLVDCLLDQ